VGDLNLRSGSELRLRNVQLDNNSGGLGLSAEAEIKYDRTALTSTGHLVSQGSEQEVNNSQLTSSGGAVAVQAKDYDLRVDASTISGSSATMLASGQDTEVTGDSALFGRMINVTAGRHLNVENSALTGAAVSMQAMETLSWNNVSMSGLNTISLSARTLVLEDVAFPSGSTVGLRSELGLLAPNPNTRQSVMAGHVNFINNVTYGGAPAQNAIGAGITIRPR